MFYVFNHCGFDWFFMSDGFLDPVLKLDDIPPCSVETPAIEMG
jgi:hypothetical protein